MFSLKIFMLSSLPTTRTLSVSMIQQLPNLVGWMVMIDFTILEFFPFSEHKLDFIFHDCNIACMFQKGILNMVQILKFGAPNQRDLCREY